MSSYLKFALGIVDQQENDDYDDGEPPEIMSHKEALACFERMQNYLLANGFNDEERLIKRVHDEVSNKYLKAGKQAKVTDFFR